MDILILVVISGIAQLAAHYFPWKKWLHRELKRTEAYAIGTVLMLVPYSIWMGWVLYCWRFVLALWAVVFISGFMVIGAYAFDERLDLREEVDAMSAENEIMRDEYFNDKDERNS